MFKRKDEPGFQTIIGQRTIMEGMKISGNDSIRIDGKYNGIIETENSVILGDTGYIEGDITCSHLIAAGNVKGNINCSDKVQLGSTAIIDGNITSLKLIVDPGAQLNGSYNIGDVKISNVNQSSNIVIDVISGELN